MTELEKELSSIVNASGFAFQLAIERAVENSDAALDFLVEAREHPWSIEGSTGFIDLILGRGGLRIVCECKRTRDANWIFLAEEPAVEVTRARLRWLAKRASGVLQGWYDFDLRTEAYESMFCVVRGQGEGDRSMLERLAATVMTSVEALAAEESDLIATSARESETFRIYLPMIVTNSRLWICRFEAGAIDLDTGSVEAPRYLEVPVVAFRKPLSPQKISDPADEGDAPHLRFKYQSEDSERTLLIVNAKALAPLLVSWKHGSITNRVMPWTAYDRR